MVHYRLLAVCLLDHAIDVKRAKDSSGALIIVNDNSITSRRDMGVIGRRNRILVTIRCPDAEWDERNAMQAFSDLVNHGRIISKICLPASPVRH